MGWKGTVRSLGAVMRAAERDAERARKQELREQIADDAAEAVADWEDHLQQLTSLHIDLGDAIDWKTIATSARPAEPRTSSKHADNAQQDLATFKPGMFDFLGGGSAKKRGRLEVVVASAPDRDRADYDDAVRAHAAAVMEWENDTKMARRLLSGDDEAIKDVIVEMQTLTKEGLIGTSISFGINDGIVHAKADVHSEDIIPKFRRKQLASGRLSETNMPVGQFNELYQDYVASVALRVAGDLFHLLPQDEVYVTCLSEMLNPQSGHQEMTPVLSVQFVRETFKGLRLDTIDPSDAMRNFNHAMNFKKTKGLARVAPLQPLE